MINIDKKNFFMLYACCIPVKGATRSILCDLQRNSFFYIPNDVFEILNQPFSLFEIVEDNKRKETFEVLNYLKEKEFGFFTSEPQNFPNIDFTLDDFPEILKNSIIDFDKNSNHDLLSIIDQLSELRCSAVELRFFDVITENVLEKYLSCLEKSTIRTLDLILQCAEWSTLEKIEKILFSYKRLSKVIVCNSPKTFFNKPNSETLVYFITDRIDNAFCCGNISPYYFQANKDFFIEALTSNTCLDKKLCIDSQGYIKNCPAMENKFGHINNTKLKDCIENDDFKKLWHIKKDDIEICKDCEFRYICPDCRAFTQFNNFYSKPKKCNYDPYTNSWC